MDDQKDKVCTDCGSACTKQADGTCTCSCEQGHASTEGDEASAEPAQ